MLVTDVQMQALFFGEAMMLFSGRSVLASA